MPDVKYAAVSASLTATGSGTTDFTSPGFGDAKGALVLVSRAVTTGVRADDQEFVVGFWDGTNQSTTGLWSEDDSPTANNTRGQNPATVIRINVNGTLTEYTVSAITDGIRLTLTVDNTTVSRLCFVMLFGGADCNTANGVVETDGTENNALDVAHGLGTTPDAVFLATSYFGGVDAATGNNGKLSLGVCNQALTQRCTMWGLDDGETTAFTLARVESDSACGGLIGFDATVGFTAEITSLDSTNIEITTRDGNQSRGVHWFALDLAGLGVDIRTLTTPTSTGNDTINDAGFDPSMLIQSLMKVTTIDTATADSNANSFQVGMTDGANQFSLCSVDEDAATTTNTFSVVRTNQLIDLDDSASGSAANFIDATTSLISGGRTHNYSVVDGTARLGWEAMFEGDIAALTVLAEGPMLSAGLLEMSGGLS